MGERTFPLVVFVVPDGGTEPKGRAPFALVLPDGTMRLGLADRRGALFVAPLPGGGVELPVPPPLPFAPP